METLAQVIESAHNIVVFTGAGISTESGIADYRSKGGLWQRFQPVTIQEFVASHEKRVEYWVTKKELMGSLQTAQPNDGHKAIVALEEMGKLKGLITQNIDGLHQRAGISREKLCELHGTNLETVCLSCGAIRPWREAYDQLQKGTQVPECGQCGQYLKANTISFGQSLDPLVLQTAFDWAADCDVMLAMGSTLVVEPAASMPRLAKQKGAKLVIVTLSETPLDAMADIVIHESVGKVMKEAVEAVSRKKNKTLSMLMAFCLLFCPVALYAEQNFVGMTQEELLQTYPLEQMRAYRMTDNEKWRTYNVVVDGQITLKTFHVQDGKVVGVTDNDREEITQEYLDEFASVGFKSHPVMWQAMTNALNHIPPAAFLKVTDRRHPVIFVEYHTNGIGRFANSSDFVMRETDPPTFQDGFYILKLTTELEESADTMAVEGIILHELAHHVLGHLQNAHSLEMEKEANRLVKAWGFEEQYLRAKEKFGRKEGNP